MPCGMQVIVEVLTLFPMEFMCILLQGLLGITNQFRNQVTVTLNEYGSAVTTTKKLNLTSFNDVDAALADIIAYNAADSIDTVVAGVLTGGSNVLYGGTASSPNTVTSSGTMTTALIRKAVVQLRTNKAVPRIGELYAAYLHPRQSADLRAEAGTGGFQELTKYVDRTPFVAGSVGVIEGAYIVETPRVLSASNGASPAVTLYKAVVAGREALAEAQAADISTVIGPEIDPTIVLLTVRPDRVPTAVMPV